MKNTIQKITPKQAALWLSEANVNNRSMRQAHVRYLANEILADRWRTTHQGIAFSGGGRLLDGQHRLAAIVLANKPVDIMVSTGLHDEEDYRAIDCGLKRANFERLHLVNDEKENRLICQAIRLFIAETHGQEHSKSVDELENEFLSKAEAWTWLGRECAKLPSKLRKAGVMAAFGIYHFVNREKAEEFMRGYRSGIELPLGSPVLRLRNDALAGDQHDVNYWRSTAIMRFHLYGKSTTKVFEVAEDMMGNKNSIRLIKQRERKGLKAAETRKKMAM